MSTKRDCSARVTQVARAHVRLGSLAPNIVTAILEGRQPANLTRTRLARTKTLPLDWNEQRRLFGFA